MNHIKTIALVCSVILNVALIGFLAVVHFTPYFNVPLAAYSYQKNCENQFEQTLKLGDQLPPEQRDQAKQMFATLVCQKDYQTGRSLTQQDFTQMFQQFSGQPIPEDVKSQLPAN